MNEELELSPAGLDLIKVSEGLRLIVYRDIVGYATIGYGHRIVAGESYTTITQAQADSILAADAAQAVAEVKRVVTVQLTQGQLDALTDFTFNDGDGNLEKSTLLKLLNMGQPVAACRELYHSDGDGHMGGWIFAAGEIVQALVIRRQAEQALWNS